MKKKITLTLSAEVVEAIDALARYLKIPRNQVITFYLEGSTYLRKAKVCKRAIFCQ